MGEIKYNATVTGKIMMTPDMMILRVRTDEPREQFVAGQYTHIGLLAAEERSMNSAIPLDSPDPALMIKRPYWIASANNETSDFEFYITQVKAGQLTPRLFNLVQGARIWVDTGIFGIFKLNEAPADCNVVMIATGTGLAPYVSFLRSHLKERADMKLAVLHGAAYPWDLGYYSELKLLESSFDNFYYFPTILKDEASWNGLTGQIQEHLEAGLLKEKAGIEIDPARTHFFLCGNPRMVATLTNFLAELGYARNSREVPGSLHIGEY